MPYRLQVDERVGEATRRAAREQLQVALQALGGQMAHDPKSAVHTARKAIKKERSLLRLTRATMPAAQRRALNANLRDAAHGLSTVRDADVIIETLAQLAQRFAGQLPESSFTAVREYFEAERAQLEETARGPGASRALAAAAAEIDGWRWRRSGWPALAPGLERTYRRGRRAMREASRRRSLEQMHAWRKRVKDLWYQERLLSAVCGPAIRGQAKDLHRLSDLLGDDHDLGVLGARLTGDALHLAADVDGVAGLIRHRQAELQAEAFTLGARIFAEKPGAFVRRMRRSWRAGRRLHAAAQQPPAAELARATRANPAG